MGYVFPLKIPLFTPSPNWNHTFENELTPDERTDELTKSMSQWKFVLFLLLPPVANCMLPIPAPHKSPCTKRPLSINTHRPPSSVCSSTSLPSPTQRTRWAPLSPAFDKRIRGVYRPRRQAGLSSPAAPGVRPSAVDKARPS